MWWRVMGSIFLSICALSSPSWLTGILWNRYKHQQVFGAPWSQHLDKHATWGREVCVQTYQTVVPSCVPGSLQWQGKARDQEAQLQFLESRVEPGWRWGLLSQQVCISALTLSHQIFWTIFFIPQFSHLKRVIFNNIHLKVLLQILINAYKHVQ